MKCCGTIHNLKTKTDIEAEKHFEFLGVKNHGMTIQGVVAAVEELNAKLKLNIKGMANK